MREPAGLRAPLDVLTGVWSPPIRPFFFFSRGEIHQCIDTNTLICGAVIMSDSYRLKPHGVPVPVAWWLGHGNAFAHIRDPASGANGVDYGPIHINPHIY
ncbi:jg17264 [Pararge aegeria aegeria]|uniref:Jg17264 protein n=1 Tax=Pararge aegeria aegeria TaxID=348720 RepID=A0A8S4S1N8_9NEOP|nr:jg17264 [Pararge aegeria aegeria]